MTRKDEIRAEMARLQAELDALDKPLPAMLPEDGNWFIPDRWTNEALYTHWDAGPGRDQNAFPTKESAEAYRDAFSLMLALRRQQGSGMRDGDGTGWLVDNDGNINWWAGSEIYCLCPPFPTPELAEAARDAVGRDRIIAAYKTLTGMV